MYSHEPQNYVCPFCQMAKGVKEEDVIFRDDFITAFISGKWWRSNPGHVLIIPNQHIENIYDMPEEIGHKIFDFSKKVALAFKETYKCDGISTRQHNEPAGDQEVWHYHLHVFPRYTGDNLYVNHKDTYLPTTIAKKPYVDKLKSYFSRKNKTNLKL